MKQMCMRIKAEISRVCCSRLKSAFTDRAVPKHMISGGLPWFLWHLGY